MIDCKHNNLIAKEPIYEAISVTLVNQNDLTDFTPGYFSYKKYVCKDCGKAIVVLNAVVEQ